MRSLPALKKLLRRSSVFLAVLALAAPALAVHGPCYECHTMHNSQNGTAVNKNGPIKHLLKYTCIGCHTGVNTGTNTVPYVMSPVPPIYNATGTEPDTNTLAGGNFYWVVYGSPYVSNPDECGHNVECLNNPDDVLLEPPGFNGTFSNVAGETVGGGTWPSGQMVTCAGYYGCHGHHRPGDDNYAGILGAHHSNIGNDGKTPLTNATTVGNSYRFLLGIYGIEDKYYEFRPTQTRHNQYYGVARTDVTSVTSDVEHTISYLCAECHGYFHTGQYISTGLSGSPWLRHPTDFDLTQATGTEYEHYNNATNPLAAPYSVVAPVASSNVTVVLSTVNVQQGAGTSQAIITCISCHRAHATPYADALRWNFEGWPANGQKNGCNVCHTAKN